MLVDEYQDTNRAQYVILRALSTDYPNLAVTGDPDQSIYGWRGADLNNILEFEHDYPNVKIVRLERNYRSTKRILRVADALIGHNLRRKKKALWTENDDGAAVRLAAYADQDHEAADIAEQIRAAVASGQPQAERLRDLLPRERPVAGIGKGAARGRRAVPDGPRPGVLCPQGNQGRAGLLPAGQQPARRHGVRADGQHAAARHRPQDDRAADRVRLSLRHAAAGSGPRGVPDRRLVERRRGQGGRVSSRSSIASRAVAHGDVEEVIGTVLEASGYRASLAGSDDEQDQNRLANIEELLTDARQFDEQNPRRRPARGISGTHLARERDRRLGHAKPTRPR